MGGAHSGCVARVKGILGVVQGYVGCFCVSDTVQDELRSEGVFTPAARCPPSAAAEHVRVSHGQACAPPSCSRNQGLTLVHFSAQLERFV